MEGIFSCSYDLTAEYCNPRGELSPLAPFIMFQSAAMRHSELLGCGVKAMEKQGKYWLCIHSRVDYFDSAGMMSAVRVETWPEKSDPKSLRCYRSYRLSCGETVLCEGRTQWAVCSRSGHLLPFSKSGYEPSFPYPSQRVCVPPPAHLRERFHDEDYIGDYRVTESDLDFMGHMNNTAYVRLMLDRMPGELFLSHRLSYLEIHYSRPCLKDDLIRLCYAERGDHCLFGCKDSLGRNAVSAAAGLQAL